MGSFQQFWRQPQRVWLRRALFQVHLWTGIGAGLYVLAISITGSAIVFRNDVYAAVESPVIIVEARGERLSLPDISKAAERAWPGYEATQSYEFPDNPQRAVEIRLEWRRLVRNRLIDPYSGKDLGAAIPWQIQAMAWLEDLHENLLGGLTGRKVNAVGGGLWAILALTGMVVWWQGIRNWKRGFIVRLKAGWKRFNWDLHSSVGFWTLLFTLMWGVTGIFASIPDPFRAAVDYLEPLQPAAPRNPPAPSEQRQEAGPRGQGGRGQRGGRGRRPRFERRVGDQILRGAYALHFGNFAGMKTKIVWAVLGLAPSLLFVTGLIMWINRKVRAKS